MGNVGDRKYKSLISNQSSLKERNIYKQSNRMYSGGMNSETELELLNSTFF